MDIEQLFAALCCVVLLACDGAQCPSSGYVINGCATSDVICTDGTHLTNNGCTWTVTKSAPASCSLAATCADGGTDSLLFPWARGAGEACVHQVELGDAAFATLVVCGGN